jgi:hypothetical protein
MFLPIGFYLILSIILMVFDRIRKLISQARELSHNMSELLAASNGAAGEGNEAKILRDKAFTLLDEKARIIRE